jgi:hypothetical protein
MTTNEIDKMWPTLFRSCKDTLGLCESNAVLAGQLSSNDSFGVISGKSYSFAMGPEGGGTLIP